jgi:DNA-binding NarL/FixJ family response regulator
MSGGSRPGIGKPDDCKWVRRVLVVEDHRLLGGLIAEALGHRGYDVAVAESVEQAQELVEEFDPDAALLDIDLGQGPSGLDLARALRHTHPEIAVTFLTRVNDVRAFAGGAALPPHTSFLRKEALQDVDQLVAALESSFDDSVPAWRQDLEHSNALTTLTAPQREAVSLAALGYTNAAIAQMRLTSERAVEMLLSSAATRLGLPPDEKLNPRIALVTEYARLAGLGNGQ